MGMLVNTAVSIPSLHFLFFPWFMYFFICLYFCRLIDWFTYVFVYFFKFFYLSIHFIFIFFFNHSFLIYLSIDPFIFYYSRYTLHIKPNAMSLLWNDRLWTPGNTQQTLFKITCLIDKFRQSKLVCFAWKNLFVTALKAWV